jgi:hypothetical protein
LVYFYFEKLGIYEDIEGQPINPSLSEFGR